MPPAINFPDAPTDRVHIRFDPERQTVYRANAKRLTANGRLKGAVVLEYVEKPSKTPTGGTFISRRMTISLKEKDGTRSKWVGQMRKDTDVVILRPAPSKK